jgi:hypothetical protein
MFVSTDISWVHLGLMQSEKGVNWYVAKIEVNEHIIKKFVIMKIILCIRVIYNYLYLLLILIFLKCYCEQGNQLGKFRYDATRRGRNWRSWYLMSRDWHWVCEF